MVEWRINMKKKCCSRIVYAVISVFLCVIVLAPLLYIFSFSIKSTSDITRNTAFFRPTLDNFRAIFSDSNGYMSFTKCLKNSVLSTLISVSAALAISCLSAYALSRLNVRCKTAINYAILGMRMIPPIAIVVPLYMIWQKIGIYDSQIGIIMPFIALNIPLSTWLLQGFFKGLPQNLEEAAEIDGCTRFQSFYKIILPLAAPGIAATSIFSFSLSWNDLTIPMALTMTKSPTLPVLAAQVKTDDGIMWGQLGAYAVLMMVPMIIFTACVSKNLVKGMASGAVKE